jgi:hypothetical protein
MVNLNEYKGCPSHAKPAIRGNSSVDLTTLDPVAHMCPIQSVLWRTVMEGYRRQITTATLFEQGRSQTEN